MFGNSKLNVNTIYLKTYFGGFEKIHSFLMEFLMKNLRIPGLTI